MTQVVIRTDQEIERALKALVELTGRNRSEVVRDAIRAAEREALLTRVRDQAEAVRNDPVDREESRQVAQEMESLRAW
ncbi:MAG: ribbon-helix-helix protein, CopG family [Bifidobacteriaceae bacterium]|nr:ribbon-helix-helix protein, CopG family [Bifidobacteriaceae bacterium]